MDCDDADLTLKDGTAIVKNWILIGREKSGRRSGQQQVLSTEGMYEL